jgi:hypothetical protein
MRILRLPVCSAIPVFDDLRLLHHAFEQLLGDSAATWLDGKGGLVNRTP